MSGLPMYVYHTNAGVFGATRFEDMSGIGNYRHLAKILPGDIANWPQRTEGKDTFSPFITFANGQANRWWTEVGGPTSGVVRHLSNVNGDEFYTLPIGILPGGVQLQPRRNMSIQVFNPLTGEVVSEMTPSANQQFTLAQGPQAYLIKGRYAGNRPASIDLGAVNDLDGLTHPRTGDGDTVAADIAGRHARTNENTAEDFYMYFNVADWFAYQANQPDLYVAVDYFDGPAGSLTLQYDSNTGDTLGAFYKNGGSIALGGTNTWKQHTFHVTDAYFGNRQNYGSDFRIGAGVGNTFYLDKVLVSLTEPTSPPQTIAFTNFNEPPLGAMAFTPVAGDTEMGFQTISTPTSGQNPLAAVTDSTTSPTTPIFAHRSVDAVTTFDTVNLSAYDDVSVSLLARVRDTTYEDGDFLRIFVTNGADEIDLVNQTGAALGALAPLDYQSYFANLPDDWTSASLVIASVSNSSAGAERFDFDNILFQGVRVSPPDLPGDIDLDRDVDRTDLALFATHLGTATGAVWSTGDFNDDGKTTLADLALLQANFGRSGASPSANAAVPEPGLAWLAVAGGLLVFRRGSTRRFAF
jgi:hypothetical protein